MTDFRLPVGDRMLDVAVTGPSGGDTVVFFHGTPGSRHPARVVLDAAVARGLRVVSWSRPGYAGSTRLPGRTVADVVPDLRAVLGHLGVERARAIGWSGGGPHALAAALLAPDLVAGSLVFAGVAPYDADGLDWRAGMGHDNLVEFGAAVEGEAALRAFLDEAHDTLSRITGAQLADAMASLLPPADVAVLDDGALAEDLAEGVREALSTGVDGWLDDDLAFVSPWGFDVSVAGAPVHLWWGDTDLMVPPSHGAWLAQRLTAPRSRHWPGEGHLSVVTHGIEEALDALLADGRVA